MSNFLNSIKEYFFTDRIGLQTKRKLSIKKKHSSVLSASNQSG